MAEDDLTPVKPPPGFPGATPQPAARIAPAGPVVAPADPDRWSTVVPLDYPLLVDGERLDQLTVRALSGVQFMGIIVDAGGDEDALLDLARAAMAGVHPAVVAGLRDIDYLRFVAACRPFLPRQLRDDPDLADVVALADEAMAGTETEA
ncbi:phage tail assembly protein [Chelatococcus sp. XZ-Ab1]|uniref:phage tail assembly protein n=1 Tax=Chelatococcus sp. XZ-Ab1 TaxID=3034027 RepID=UPI0023E3ADAE|nr:phage tail assembly protein [Chelatococcus sp. XZ-Ab1]